MSRAAMIPRSHRHLLRYGWILAIATLCLFQSSTAWALPVFARQTGQSCVACHAGGQFPELTPYGRMFKLNGYTLGERTVPIAVMGTLDLSSTRRNHDANGNVISPKDSLPIFDAASIFFAGKITDKIGAFTQFTYTNYDHQDSNGRWVGHWHSDNMDFRYVDRIIGDTNDLILGATLNNNPTVQDPWNSTPAWGYPYVSSPTSKVGMPQFLPIIEGALGQQVVGAGGYVYWNRTIYAELSLYSTADGIWSFMSKGNKPGDLEHPQIYLRGQNPYWRLALTREWGPHNVMVGTFGMSVNIYPNSASAFPVFTQGVTRYRDIGFDAQYQYLLEPNTVTAQIRYIRENISDPNNLVFGDSKSANLKSLRVKLSYVYQAKYGVSFSFFNVTGSRDSTAYSGSASFSPATQGWTPEIFWVPVQNIRIGLQYTHFTKYLGARTNYDGQGRNASDNDTLLLYVWAAYW
ncbi:cytochrome C [Trinickia symbiotica]|nr:cytochrome C [Trinickia symbiotica]